MSSVRFGACSVRISVTRVFEVRKRRTHCFLSQTLPRIAADHLHCPLTFLENVLSIGNNGLPAPSCRRLFGGYTDPVIPCYNTIDMSTSNFSPSTRRGKVIFFAHREIKAKEKSLSWCLRAVRQTVSQGEWFHFKSMKFKSVSYIYFSGKLKVVHICYARSRKLFVTYQVTEKSALSIIRLRYRCGHWRFEWNVEQINLEIERAKNSTNVTNVVIWFSFVLAKR